jgi:hypothetical protein
MVAQVNMQCSRGNAITQNRANLAEAVHLYAYATTCQSCMQGIPEKDF